MTTSLSESLAPLWANLPDITKAALVLIVAFAVYFHIRYTERTATYAPTILTTTGIFFTFLGVALGLASFDSNNVQASVPTLLSGLKTAFWASVAGVFGALTVKFRHFFSVGGSIGTGADGDVTAEDLAKLLGGIQHALVGSDDSTLITQMKLTRSDINDRLDSLKQAQLDALQKLSEMSSKTLVEALKDVIRDFNTKITEQFGDNFRNLNDAVGKLLTWQEQYKLHLDESGRILQNIISDMRAASERYSDLVEKAGIFSSVAAELSSLLSALQQQKTQLTTSLEALAKLLLTASTGLPQVESKVLQLTEQLSSAVQQNQKAVGDALSQNVLLIRNSIQAVGQDFTKVNDAFNKQMTDAANKTREQVAALDAALAEELKKSLESLGRQLTALSAKFVEDYSPLTDRLRQVVAMARQPA